MTNFKIRQMDIRDIDLVMKVEKESFSTYWPREIFQQELNSNKHAHYYVLETNGKIVGYAGLWVIQEDAQITNIAIIPDYRGKKLGEKLFSFVFQKAIQFGSRRLSLEVRASNVIAQRMYRKFGLVPGGIRKGYYTDNKEDAIVMWVNIR